MSEFKTYVGGFRHVCLICWQPVSRAEYHKNKDNDQRKNNRKKRRVIENAKESKERMNKENIAKFVLQDSKTNGTTKGLENTLTIEFVIQMLQLPCSYCGIEQKDLTVGRIGLDRKDSTIGYIQSNVVQACSRCNFLKRDMPYAAWEVLIPAVRAARERGLFGEWIGGWIKNNKK